MSPEYQNRVFALAFRRDFGLITNRSRTRYGRLQRARRLHLVIRRVSRFSADAVPSSNQRQALVLQRFRGRNRSSTSCWTVPPRRPERAVGIIWTFRWIRSLPSIARPSICGRCVKRELDERGGATGHPANDSPKPTQHIRASAGRAVSTTSVALSRVRRTNLMSPVLGRAKRTVVTLLSQAVVERHAEDLRPAATLIRSSGRLPFMRFGPRVAGRVPLAGACLRFGPNAAMNFTHPTTRGFTASKSDTVVYA